MMDIISVLLLKRSSEVPVRAPIQVHTITYKKGFILRDHGPKTTYRNAQHQQQENNNVVFLSKTHPNSFNPNPTQPYKSQYSIWTYGKSQTMERDANT